MYSFFARIIEEAEGIILWPHHKRLFRLKLRHHREDGHMATSLNLTVGGATGLLTLTGTDQFGNPIPIPATPVPGYTSDNPSVATVAPVASNPNQCVVTAVGAGTCNITANDTASANPNSNPVPVTVVAPAPALTNLQLG
jgi:hypothetical protein